MRIALIGILLNLGLLSGGALAWAIEVHDWSLSASVFVPGVGSDSDFSGTPANPFSATLSAQQSSTLAISEHVFAWQPNGTATFLIEAQHAAEGNAGGPVLHARTNGSIWLTPSIESILTIDAVYNYALGNGDRRSITLSRLAAVAAASAFFIRSSRLLATRRWDN